MNISYEKIEFLRIMTDRQMSLLKSIVKNDLANAEHQVLYDLLLEITYNNKIELETILQ